MDAHPVKYFMDEINFIGKKIKNCPLSKLQKYYINGILHLLPKISMFCALSQKKKKINTLKNNICILQ